jgi:hypothetical protein
MIGWMQTRSEGRKHFLLCSSPRWNQYFVSNCCRKRQTCHMKLVLLIGSLCTNLRCWFTICSLSNVLCLVSTAWVCPVDSHSSHKSIILRNNKILRHHIIVASQQQMLRQQLDTAVISTVRTTAFIVALI